MRLTEEHYEEIIVENERQIQNLISIIHSMKQGTHSGLASLLQRLIKERNELDIQRREAVTHFHLLVKDNEDCRHITKHFTVK